MNIIFLIVQTWALIPCAYYAREHWNDADYWYDAPDQYRTRITKAMMYGLAAIACLIADIITIHDMLQ